MTEPRKASPLIRFLIEFGPLIAFFVTQRVTERLNGLYWATIVFMGAIVVALVAARVLEKRWPIVPLITAVFVLIMGGLTIYLDSELFIKLKPTLVNSLFAAILLIGLAKQRLFLKQLLGDAIAMEDEGWRALTWRFGLWFVFLALLNEVVRVKLSPDGWTTFKSFVLPILSVVFMLTQMPLFKRFEIPEAADAGDGEPPDA